MPNIRIIKSYEVLVRSKAQLPIDEDRAVANYRAFYHLASLEAERVQDGLAKEIMTEVLESLLNILRDKTPLV